MQLIAWRRTRAGQSLLEYAVLIGAVVLGVAAIARIFAIRFTEHAQRIEAEYMVF